MPSMRVAKKKPPRRASIPGNKDRSSDEIILACKEFGCPWDPYPATVLERDYFDVWRWFRKIRCINCGSVKIEKYAVGDVYFEHRLTTPRYIRPPGWYDVELRVYWGGAREQRARSGYLGEVQEPEDQEYEGEDAEVVSIRGRSA